MESPSERIAREISIMQACGGPLSRADWMRHIADELGAIQPCSAADLAALATVLVSGLDWSIHVRHLVLVAAAAWTLSSASSRAES